MIYILDGEVINGQSFVINDIQYGPLWCEAASDNERDALGIVTLAQIYPPLGENQRYDGNYVDDMSLKTRTYNIVDVPQPQPGDTDQIELQISVLIRQQQKLIPGFLLNIQASKDQMQALQDQIDILTAQLEN